MTGISPGRAAYEAWQSKRTGIPDGDWRWDILGGDDGNAHEAWEAAARAAIEVTELTHDADLERERDEARAVVREMLAVLAEYGEGGQDNDQIVSWRQRAGIDGGS